MTQGPETPDQNPTPEGEPVPPPSAGEPVPPPYGGQVPPPADQQVPPPPYGQPAPPPPGGIPYGASPAAPYGVHPVTGVPYSDKSKLIAGLLQIFLGGLGIGRFYIGDTKTGIWQIVVTLVTCGIGSIWGLVDGIIMLATDNVTDSAGRPLRPN
ncbi:TM2 domain-containing protein [Nocardioides sp.]|uniref:TM2 domain-containing protein n=1 Tax=Nocardioides sp. TaxID=35761 RepID=UPI0037852B32